MTTIENARLAPETGVIGRAGAASNEPACRFVGLNNPRVEFPADKCIHQLIEEQVQRTPNSTAVICENQRLTYRELQDRVDDLACALQLLGIGPDVPVGICLERSVDMMVGLLAILKAGGCYVPLDPAYPRDCLMFVLADAQPPVLLTQKSLRNDLNFEIPELKLLCVDELDHAPRITSRISANTEPGIPAASHDSSRLAYVIYTSGSTGKPKGVMVTHRNIANFFAGMDRVLGVDPGVWLAVTSISFDISVLELFWTLARGFTVVLYSEASRTKPQPKVIGQTADLASLSPLRGEEVRVSPAAEQEIHSSRNQRSISDQILEHGVTHFQCTPSLAGNLIRTPESSEGLRQLRKFLVGGEALPAALATQLLQILRGELLNMYGPTETTVWSATHLVRQANGIVPIGRPIANTEIHLLNDQLQPIAAGEPGELLIGGEGVARGYLNRPELTAEKFIVDPFSLDASARLYRTGDIGRYGADGTIEFLGRADHQVKLQGHRIELGEIESVLRQHTRVRECVVHVWEAGPDDKRLVAYIVPLGAASALAIELRRFLESTLPSFMIPAAFVSLEALPLTPNGKIDRNALPKPNEVRPATDPAYVPPQTQIEEAIACIWRQVLRVEKVGVHDNFFDLGGNSLLLMETHAKLCIALSVDLPVVRFFEHPTVAALTEFLASHKKASLSNIHERATRQREAFARRQFQAATV
ncbi:MAG TPA: non-ribosomal peptide synthetase [Candidatus Acidoferrum sp.]|jgi:non-ribosomal peptide synthetase component F|nr:non-ribosomal peptide synthetase [Candidatus Acidoferrum sp.]